MRSYVGGCVGSVYTATGRQVGGCVGFAARPRGRYVGGNVGFIEAAQGRHVGGCAGWIAARGAAERAAAVLQSQESVPQARAWEERWALV
jgi:hypothetical protein